MIEEKKIGEFFKKRDFLGNERFLKMRHFFEMRHFLKMGDFCHTSLFLSREDFSVEYATILRNCGRKKNVGGKKITRRFYLLSENFVI